MSKHTTTPDSLRAFLAASAAAARALTRRATIAAYSADERHAAPLNHVLRLLGFGYRNIGRLMAGETTFAICRHLAERSGPHDNVHLPRLRRTRRAGHAVIVGLDLAGFPEACQRTWSRITAARIGAQHRREGAGRRRGTHMGNTWEVWAWVEVDSAASGYDYVQIYGGESAHSDAKSA